MSPVSALFLCLSRPRASAAIRGREKGARPGGREGTARQLMPRVSRMAWKDAAGGGALLALASPAAGGYGFVHAQRYSKPGLVSGRGLVGGRGLPAPAAAWRDAGAGGGGEAAGQRFSVGAAAPLWVPAPRDGLFLGMRFVPQKPVYLHHRLRRQLAQHLQEKPVVERTLKKGVRLQGPGSSSEARRVSAAPLPRPLSLWGPLLCKAGTL